MSLLDTYQAERHPVAARVLRNTMAQRALGAADDRSVALRDTVVELLRMDEPRKHIAAMISGLDVAYDLGGRHPLVGRRMPDLDLLSADGTVRVFSLLHDARPVLLNLGDARRLRHHSMGRSGSADRCQIQRHMGASGDRGRHGSPPRC